MQQQNEALKTQVETLNHVQAKLVAKNKRYREMAKEQLESQLGMFNPGDVAQDEKIQKIRQEALEAKAAGRNSAQDGGIANGKQSVASMGKESAVSLPDEAKIQGEIDKLIESEEEDDVVVEQIEGAQNVRLNAEKDDNAALKKQVTSLQGAVRRATLKAGDPANAAALAAALTANNAGALPGST